MFHLLNHIYNDNADLSAARLSAGWASYYDIIEVFEVLYYKIIFRMTIIREHEWFTENFI